MSKILRNWSLGAGLLLLAGYGRAQQTVETPTYSNAQVISVDPQQRVLVIRTAGGFRKSLPFDDLLAGTGGIKAGDRVIVTVRGGPGRERVSALSVVTPSRPSNSRRVPASATPEPTAQEVRPTAESLAALTRYSEHVAVTSSQAAPIDALWASFIRTCQVRPVSNEGGGRDWFGLWDGRVIADYSGSQCRDLFNQIVAGGELVKKSMVSAETGIEKFLTPGEIRDIRRRHSMNWDGWTLPPPQRREP